MAGIAVLLGATIYWAANDSLEQRVADLERRVAALESAEPRFIPAEPNQ